MKKKIQKGQALVEYVLLVMMIAGLSKLLFGMMPRLFTALEKPLTGDLKAAYRYGNPKACGYDADEGGDCNGEPTNHPRYAVSGNYFVFGRSK